MQTRFLGRSGIEVSVLGFGAMTFSRGEGPFGVIGATQGDEARRQVDMCIEAGVNLFDTADAYAEGKSEEILGQALGRRRPGVIVATKAFFPSGPHPHDRGLSRRHLIAACEESLRRLGTEWIDLYQLHYFDGMVPLEETLRALDDLVTSGKVRYVGCSNFGGWQLMKAAALADRNDWSRFVSHQFQYSLMTRDVEEEVLPCGVDQGIGGLIWGALAQGFLTGKFRDGAQDGTRMAAWNRLGRYATSRGDAVLQAIDAIIDARGNVTAGQVALNWLLARPGVASVLIGARTQEQLADSLAAAQWSLTQEEIDALDRASQQEERYPSNYQRINSFGRNPKLFSYHEAK